ncbi:MAG: hypothetical protein JSW61_12180 [Candidatus Thorarchaeota archaeon]|nr:MAG: hypothetical protein JSW61_12180 [Candidatus Thorarchaeota archaeon]
MSERMRVGELIFECIQRGNKSGGLTGEAVIAIAKIIRDEIRYYDSPESRQERKWDHTVSQSLTDVSQALEEIWSKQPRGLRLHHITPIRAHSSKATAHEILHKTRAELVIELDTII